MKRQISVLLIGLLLLAAGCSQPAPAPTETTAPETTAAETPALADGVYFAEEASFNPETGWKEIVRLEVADGKIVKATWNGANVKAGLDKISASKGGQYPMVEKGGAKAPWHDQAAAVEQYLIGNQDPTALAYKDDQGHTDAISGATMSVKGFFTLADQALKAGPAEPGPYKDGAYHAEQKAFDPKTGWKDSVDLTVVNGRIVAAYWNGVHKDGGDDKRTASASGKYPMVEQGGAKAPWHEQAALVERYLMEKQDPKAVQYKDDAGHTDAVAGATITVQEFFLLADEALASAR